ncbi:MAG: hypothetical protein AAGA85_02295 [Bacteroidota bacterium]
MKSLLTAIPFFTLLIAYGQVGEVKERARDFKQVGRSGSSESRSSSGGSDGFSELFIAEAAWAVLQLPIEGLIQGQTYQLQRRHDEPWRISLEMSVTGGFDPGKEVTLLAPTVRGNWGLFSTQLRYNRVFDQTGTLSTWDWQILQFNIANTEHVRLVGGVGFSHEVEIDQRHFEGLGELSVFLADRKFVPTAIFRWSGNGVPRKDFSALVSYRPHGHRDGPTTSFEFGYQHQNWYGIQFNFIRMGLGIILR